MGYHESKGRQAFALLWVVAEGPWSSTVCIRGVCVVYVEYLVCAHVCACARVCVFVSVGELVYAHTVNSASLKAYLRARHVRAVQTLKYLPA